VLSDWLTTIGLRFDDPAEEQAFQQRFVFDRVNLAKAAMLLGALQYYIFFAWDAAIDPIGGRTTHMIRGLVIVPMIAVSVALLCIPKLRAWYEVIMVFALWGAIAGLTVIYAILKLGFDYGAGGTVLITMFAFSLIPLRFMSFVIFCAISWITFGVGEYASGNYVPATPLINNLSFGTAIMFGLFSAFVKETSERRKYSISKDLVAANARVGELLDTLTASDSTTMHDAVRVFLSYRRADAAAIAGRMRDRLVKHFGEESIFMDIDSIPLGRDFRAHVREEIGKSNLMVVVIGAAWVGDLPSGTTRIADDADPVRMEIEAALQLGIPTIPVLVGGAQMPNASTLPPSLAAMAYLNAAYVDDGRDFHQHMDRLVRSIVQAIRGAPRAQVDAPN
jgi:hypothetical protein